MDKIGNVILDYTFYKGADAYSDGSIEEELLKYVQENEDELEILKKDNRWPILYHVSPVRKNILEWYEFKDLSEVLEVGSGCGAITGVLCDKTKQVTCVELSKQRSLINANRNKKYSNLKILVGNFNDIEIDKKYDYITLIGVLEYAGYYTESDNPFEDFLKRLRKHLKDDGKLLIAIENKFGLKYWSGAPEDHTGKYFDSIINYVKTDGKVRTFSKMELEKLISNAGYSKSNFYYPFPDYKFPQQIFSNDYLPREDELIYSRDCFDNNRISLFDQTAALRNIIKSEQFEFFSNSYFIEVEY